MVNYSHYATIVIATHSLITWPAAVVCGKLLTSPFQISFLLFFFPHTSPLCLSFGFGFCVHTLRHNNQRGPLCDTWACWQKYPPSLAPGWLQRHIIYNRPQARLYAHVHTHCSLARNAAPRTLSCLSGSSLQGFKYSIVNWEWRGK